MRTTLHNGLFVQQVDLVTVADAGQPVRGGVWTARPLDPRPIPTPDGEAYITPLVRKLAMEHGVDLTTITGTGVAGRILKQDVLDEAQRLHGRAPQR